MAKVYKRKVHKKRVPKMNTLSAVKHVAKKAFLGVTALRGIINSEKKAFDVINSGTSIDYNGTVVNLSAIAQGDNYNDRTGNSILAKSLQFRYTFTADATVSTTSVRVIIFQDTMSLGTVPAPGDVLTTVGASHTICSCYSRIFSLQHRFKILYDKVQGLSNTSAQLFNASEYLPLNDHIKYTGTAGTDEARNQLYVLFLSQRVTSNLPIVQYHSRLLYYDN